MAASKGIVYIAYGKKAMQEVEWSLQQPIIHDYPHEVFHDYPFGIYEDKPVNPIAEFNSAQTARYRKTKLYHLTPFEHTLYLDADTRVTGDLQPGFDLLADGFDMVIVPSMNQGDELLWHITPEERETTFDECGFHPLQLQAGVFWFAKNERTYAFFQAWHNEWLRWSGEDQGAFTRALHRCSIKLWLLGRPFNGGAVIQHHFGACR